MQIFKFWGEKGVNKKIHHRDPQEALPCTIMWFGVQIVKNRSTVADQRDLLPYWQLRRHLLPLATKKEIEVSIHRAESIS